MPWGVRAHSAPLVLFGGEGTENRQIVCFGWRELGKLGAGAQICRVFVLRRVCGGAPAVVGVWARAVVEFDQLQPIRWRAHSAPSVLFGGEGTKNRQIWVLGESDLGK